MKPTKVDDPTAYSQLTLPDISHVLFPLETQAACSYIDHDLRIYVYQDITSDGSSWILDYDIFGHPIHLKPRTPDHTP